MPRYTLHRIAVPVEHESTSIDGQHEPVLEKLRADERLRIIGELPGMLLVECDAAVADEWAARMPRWVIRLEQKARHPDPRPKIKFKRP